jgi:hypothetical protein
MRFCDQCGAVVLLTLPNGVVIPLVFCSRTCLDNYSRNKPAYSESTARQRGDKSRSET